MSSCVFMGDILLPDEGKLQLLVFVERDGLGDVEVVLHGEGGEEAVGADLVTGSEFDVEFGEVGVVEVV